MRLKIKESVIINYELDRTIIIYGTLKLSIKDKNKYYFSKLQQAEFSLNDKNLEFINFLTTHNLVVKNYNNDFINTRFEKNIYYFENKANFSKHLEPNDIQRLISKKNVCILGCGGIGSVVIKNLSATGVENFILIDFDFVELSNLNRQIMFSKENISQKKSQALKYILENDYKNKADAIDLKINSLEDLEKLNLNIDFFVNCADEPQNITNICYNYCMKNKIPLINGAVGIDTRYWGPIYDSKIKLNTNFKKAEFTNSTQASICCTNMLISSYMANDIIDYWIDPDNPKLYKQKILNFSEYTIEVI